MASFFSRLFSGFSGEKREEPVAKQSEPRQFGDYRIYATPMKEGSQFRLAGRIERDFDGEIRVHEFVRADVFTSMDDAVDFTFRKAEQIITQSGDSIFTSGR